MPSINGTFIYSFNDLHMCIYKSKCNEIYEKNTTRRIKMQKMIDCWNKNHHYKNLPKLCDESGNLNFFNCSNYVSYNIGFSSPSPY